MPDEIDLKPDPISAAYIDVMRSGNREGSSMLPSEAAKIVSDMFLITPERVLLTFGHYAIAKRKLEERRDNPPRS